MRIDLITAIPEIFGISHNFPGFPEKNWKFSQNFSDAPPSRSDKSRHRCFAQTLYMGVDTPRGFNLSSSIVLLLAPASERIV